jgi:hypothetical protein
MITLYTALGPERARPSRFELLARRQDRRTGAKIRPTFGIAVQQHLRVIAYLIDMLIFSINPDLITRTDLHIEFYPVMV